MAMGTMVPGAAWAVTQASAARAAAKPSQAVGPLAPPAAAAAIQSRSSTS